LVVVYGGVVSRCIVYTVVFVVMCVCTSLL